MRQPEKYRDLEKLIGQIRKEYHFGKLERENLTPDPFDQFAHWFMDAVKHCDAKANVMVLSTSEKDRVTSRSVLLKGFDERGLLFYTQKQSRKARALRANPHASVCFYWTELERQVTIHGLVREIPRAEAEVYFRSRPREAQIASWCSRQSNVIESREELDRRFREVEKKYDGREIPFNPEWGGFRLEPEEFEFWQGRLNRLNDRFRYRYHDKAWLIERLEP